MNFLFYFIENQLQRKVGELAYLEDWITTITSLTAGKSAFKVTFHWDNEIGVPGAILIKNKHHSEFYLKSITLEDVPDKARSTSFATHGFTLWTNTRKTAFSSLTR